MEKMLNRVYFLVFCVILNEAFSQTLDNLITTQVIQKPSPSTADSKWEELLPALQSIKGTSKIKKERLYNVIKIIKFLLSDEGDKTDCIIEKFKEPEDFENLPIPEIPDIDSIVEERLKSIQGVINDKYYMADKSELVKETVKEDLPAKNKTADFSKILSKISAALAKLKEANQCSESSAPNQVPIFRPKNACKSDFKPIFLENPKQLGAILGQSEINPLSTTSMFNIPCQRASDILSETATFQLPREMFCDNPAVNLNSLAKNTKLNLDNLPFDNVVPNSVTCVDSEDSIAILFKPKTISLMQVYGNLLKKITITVLVPYYVSKLPF